MRRLIEGVREFQSQIFAAQRALFERLAALQTAEVLFITCFDSRIDPNLITQSLPGDLFVLRNAGNVVPPYSVASGGEAATIEMAVDGMGVRDIIVCGHSRCAAMMGLLDQNMVNGLPTVQRWLRNASAVKRVLEEKFAQETTAQRWERAIEINVLTQLDHLRTHPSVADAAARGQLNLHGWVYELETGEVRQYEPEAGRFLSLGAQ
jgi:carbonic anhydrase